MIAQSVKERLTPHTSVGHLFSQIQTQTKSLFGMEFYGMGSLLYMQKVGRTCVCITVCPYHRSAFKIWTWADQLG